MFFPLNGFAQKRFFNVPAETEIAEDAKRISISRTALHEKEDGNEKNNRGGSG